VRYEKDKVRVYPNPVIHRLVVGSPNGGTVVFYNHLGLKAGEYQLGEG